MVTVVMVVVNEETIDDPPMNPWRFRDKRRLITPCPVPRRTERKREKKDTFGMYVYTVSKYVCISPVVSVGVGVGMGVSVWVWWRERGEERQGEDENELMP